MIFSRNVWFKTVDAQEFPVQQRAEDRGSFDGDQQFLSNLPKCSTKILVVEDNLLNQKIIETMLLQLGYQV